MKDRAAVCRNEAALDSVRRATAVLNPLVRASQTADLAAPLGTMMRPTLTVEAGDSLARGAQTLRENGGSMLPVVDEEGVLQGVLTDAGLARALAEACEATDAVGGFLEAADTLPPYSTAAEALRRGLDGRTHVVVDDARRPVGLVSALDLWPRRRTLPRPAMVGGLATPFGVYLTTGNVSAGAPWWALAGTGAAMFTMFATGIEVSTVATRNGMSTALFWPVAGAILMLLMRLTPLSGIHGAEHQVVHAIEREEILSPEVVRRMPRVHPRCGTNLVVGLAIFGGLLLIPGFGEYGMVFALVAAVAFARPAGSLVQRFVTTKVPTERQLTGAIRAGEALLLANATARHSTTSPLRRIWSMGVVQVAGGAYLLVGLLMFVEWLTGATWLPDIAR